MAGASRTGRTTTTTKNKSTTAGSVSDTAIQRKGILLKGFFFCLPFFCAILQRSTSCLMLNASLGAARRRRVYNLGCFWNLGGFTLLGCVTYLIGLVHVQLLFFIIELCLSGAGLVLHVFIGCRFSIWLLVAHWNGNWPA